jgi:hypothetical protein
MRTTVAVIILGTLVAPCAVAATAKNLSAPAEQPAMPALIQTTKAEVNDSALVRAAKSMVAKRGAAQGTVITNANLASSSSGKGRFAEANESIADVNLEAPAELPPPGEVETYTPPPDPAKLAADREKLERDMARAAAQAESEFADPTVGAGGDEYEEGMAEQVMTETPQKIDAIDSQLATPKMPPPPNPNNP